MNIRKILFLPCSIFVALTTFVYAQECTIDLCQSSTGAVCSADSETVFYYKNGSVDLDAMKSQCKNFEGSFPQWVPSRNAYQCIKDGHDAGYGLNIEPIYKQVKTNFCSINDKPAPPEDVCYIVDINRERIEFPIWWRANIPTIRDGYMVANTTPTPYVRSRAGHIMVYYKDLSNKEPHLYSKRFSRPWVSSDNPDDCKEPIDPSENLPDEKPHPPKGGDGGNNGGDGGNNGGTGGNNGGDGGNNGGTGGNNGGDGGNNGGTGGNNGGTGGNNGGTGGNNGGDGNGNGNGNGTGEGGEYEKSDLDCNGPNCFGVGHGVGVGKMPVGDPKEIYKSEKADKDLGKYIVDNVPDVRSSKIGQELNKLIPVLPVGQCPKFTIQGFSMMGRVLMETQTVNIPCWIYDLIRTFLHILAVIYSRKIIFGA